MKYYLNLQAQKMIILFLEMKMEKLQPTNLKDKKMDCFKGMKLILKHQINLKKYLIILKVILISQRIRLITLI